MHPCASFVHGLNHRHHQGRRRHHHLVVLHHYIAAGRALATEYCACAAEERPSLCHDQQQAEAASPEV
jgi:hypothetical protein